MNKHAVLVNYNFSPNDWWLNYGYEAENVTMYDRSDDGIQHKFSAKTIRTPNVGNVDYDKLSYLVNNYDSLPDVFLWGKSNLFKYITEEEFKTYDDEQAFAPLLTQNHRTYSDPDGTPVCFYKNGMYHERCGIVNTMPFIAPWKHFNTWEKWCGHFNVPYAMWIPFPPGGNFILTRERVHRYPKDLYKRMRDTLGYTQLPTEAYFAERSYYLMFK